MGDFSGYNHWLIEETTPEVQMGDMFWDNHCRVEIITKLQVSQVFRKDYNCRVCWIPVRTHWKVEERT